MILAPLAGVSDGVHRYMCHREGAGLSYTEMVSAKGLYYKSPGTEDLLRILGKEGPVGIQLFGSEPEMIDFAVRKLADYPNVLFDINMGCPVPKVYKNGEGSALLKDKNLAAKIVEAAVKASNETSKKPITVKMRLASAEGQSKKKPSEVDPCDLQKSIEFAKALESAGASAIAVHGRTREQYYSGQSDWDAIREIKSAVSIPIIGNGDVRSRADADKMRKLTGCDLVMIGRASMGNPWVFSCGKPKDPNAISDMLAEHFELLLEEQGERRAVMESRKHFAWYTKGMRGSAELRQKVNTANNAEDIRKYIKELK